MVGQIRTGARIVGLLGFPSNQAVLHINFPAARTGTVHTVSGTYHFIVLPAAAVGIFPFAVFFGQYAVSVGKGLMFLAEKFQSV